MVAAGPALEKCNGLRGCVVAGVAAIAVEQSFNRVRPGLPEPGDDVIATTFYTNDAQGLRIHAAEALGIPFLGLILDVDTTSVPAQLLVPADAPLGSTWVVEGSQDAVLHNGADAIELNSEYRSTTTVGSAPEMVSSPAGTFEAIRLTTELYTNSLVAGESTVIDTVWYARGVGPVRRSSQTDDGPVTVLELSQFVVPEPTRASLAAWALVALGVLRGRRDEAMARASLYCRG